MLRRAQQVEETRRRIVAATVDLHGSVGPANTTVSAIAEAAGVTRVTVYSHFPDEDALFAACTSHWAAHQRMPDLAGWRAISAPEDRAKAALMDLYRFFHEAAPMLTLTTRDRDVLPDFVRQRNEQTSQTQKMRSWVWVVCSLRGRTKSGSAFRSRVVSVSIGSASW